MQTLFLELRILFHRDFGNISNMILSSRELFEPSFLVAVAVEQPRSAFPLAGPPSAAGTSIPKITKILMITTSDASGRNAPIL